MSDSAPGRGQPSAAPFVPAGADLAELRRAAAECRGCHLHELDNQTVFSAGEPTARVVLLGEQPGDQEDRRGEPFVGPAGRVLDQALDQAGINRADTYVTNAVKHFKFTRSGKRRIHRTPDMRELGACRPWLTAELHIVDPEVVVCLGATAGKALLGPSFRVTQQRGLLLPRPALDEQDAARQNGFVVPTTHPSAVLRADEGARDQVFGGFVADLQVAAQVLSG